MEKVKTKLKETFTDKELYVFSIITILFFGIFCIMQYAPDTYTVFTGNVKDTVLHFFTCGRFITGIAEYFFIVILRLNNATVYKLSYVFAIICTIISLYKLNKLIKKDVKHDIASIIISTLIIINPFSLELFLYIEKGILLLSVLLCILAVEQIEKFFCGNKKSIIYALIFMMIANCCYQGTVGVFVAIAVIYAIKYSKNIKEFIINNIVVALTYGIPAIINFLLVRFIFTNSRVEGKIEISKAISKIMQGTSNMVINTYSLLPKYLFISAIVILLGVIICTSIIKKSKIKQKILQILGAMYLIVIALIVTVAPQILQDTNQIWFVARSSYPMASIIGILTLYLFMQFDFKDIIKNIIIIMVTIFLIIQFGNFMKFSIDNYIGNYMDKTVTLEIKEMIVEYEKETGNEIDSISVYKDAMTPYNYVHINTSGDINIKAYSSDWCIIPILKLYTNREFKMIENNEEIKKEFSEKDWNFFDREQVIFENNIMHLCIF